MPVIRPLLVICLLWALADCRPNYRPVVPGIWQNRTLTAGQGNEQLSATYFAPSRQTKIKLLPLVLLEPVLLDKTVLHRGEEGGLIAWLNFKGYGVWLVHSKDKGRLHELWAAAGRQLMQKISARSGAKKFYLGRLSLGGRGLLAGFVRDNAAPRPLKNDGFLFEKIFFFGTAFDYNYPGSFFAVTTGNGLTPGALAGQLKTKCSGEPAYCRRFSLFENKNRKFTGTLPPENVVPDSALWRSMKTPVLFIVGKADNVAPSEAVFSNYLSYGQSANETSLVDTGINKMFLNAGHGNHFAINFDHLDLFTAPEAERSVYKYLHRWLQNKI